MREIIHIQAGALPNYVGSHYWNTQESYFAYDEDADTSITDHNISFKEGRDDHNQPTLCPRLLAFDQKSNFGTLSGRPSHQGETLSWPTTWHGGIVHQEQARIPQSEYHSHLDAADAGEQAEPVATKIRYWSDFSRVFFDPKSIQAVPDTLVEADWSSSREAFSRYDDNAELMDGSFRLLVEECDNFQGVQMIQDTSTFGGFTCSLLSAFREECPKATLATFACLSSIHPLDAHHEDPSQVKRVLNDTLSLRSATEFCDLTVPILSSSFWENNCWFSGHHVDNNSLYHSSAILSAYIETATLPLRLKGGRDDLQTLVSHLNWSKSSPLALLSGALCPHGFSGENFPDIPSLSFHSNGWAPFARRDVSRGFSQDDVALYNTRSKAHELKAPFFMWHHLPGYPVPTSFPPIFPGAQPKALKLMSSLSTCASVGSHLSGYARFVEGAAKRRDGALLATGLEDDEVKELASALWDIVDGYGEIGGSGDSSGGMGEDED